MAVNLLTPIDDDIGHKYPGLISLNVQDKRLQSLVGLEHVTFLQKISASGNNIIVVPTWLLIESRNLKTLDLSNNPFHCKCGIKPFKNWILSDNQTWLQPGEYVCTTPEKLQGMSITAIDLDCRSKTAFYLRVTIPSTLMLFMVIIILFRYRWHIEYKLFLLYRNYHPFPDIDEDFEMLQLQYHAYVACNENSAVDDAWVMNDLQPNMEEGPEPVEISLQDTFFETELMKVSIKAARPSWCSVAYPGGVHSASLHPGGSKRGAKKEGRKRKKQGKGKKKRERKGAPKKERREGKENMQKKRKRGKKSKENRI